MSKIMQGDSLLLLKKFKDKQFDLVVTSPPFLDKDVPEPYLAWLEKVIGEIKRVSRIAFVFNSSRRLIDICRDDILVPRRILIWDKMVGMGAYRYEPILVYAEGERIDGPGRIWSDCIKMVPVLGKKQLVPYENPVLLYTQLIRYFKECRNVLDPFAGSGTTALAAISLQKEYVLIEQNELLIAIIRKRIKETA